MIINQVVQGSGGGSSDPYPLLSRVTDDSNNEIGTVCGYHTDANSQKYAVVCLDAQYRGASLKIFPSNAGTGRLPYYTDLGVFDAKETATTNTDALVAAIQAIFNPGTVSPAINQCRSQSFVIGGVTYYGQIPTLTELTEIFSNTTSINSLDTSATSNPTLVIPATSNTWASNSYSYNNTWCITGSGSTASSTREKEFFVIPVLEIPIN